MLGVHGLFGHDVCVLKYFMQFTVTFLVKIKLYIHSLISFLIITCCAQYTGCHICLYFVGNSYRPSLNLRYFAFSRRFFFVQSVFLLLLFLSLFVRHWIYLSLFRTLLAINNVRIFFDLAAFSLLSVSFTIFLSNLHPTLCFWFMWKCFVSNLLQELLYLT